MLQDEAALGPEGGQTIEDSPDSSQQGSPADESDREVGGHWCSCLHRLQAAGGGSKLQLARGLWRLALLQPDMVPWSSRAQQPSAVPQDTQY